MTRERTKNRRRTGLSLVELLLALVILGLLMGSAGMVSSSSRGVYRSSMTETTLENNLYSTLRRVAEELASTGADMLDPATQGVDYSTVDYTHEGLENGVVVAGPVARLTLEPDDGEILDGIDNDGDEWIDESRLVYIRDLGLATERRIVLANHVSALDEGEEANGLDDDEDGLIDEQGFHVVRQGDVVFVRITMQTRDPDGRPMFRSAETSVRMRN